MNKLGDMREYQKVAYSYRLKHGLRPDIKSELRRNYFGCAQFVRLSALLLTETYIWNIVRGLSHFLYETGTYNSEKNDNWLAYLAELYTLSDTAKRAYRSRFYSTSHFGDKLSNNNGPTGTLAEIKFFSAAEDLDNLVGKISARIARIKGLSINEAETYINIFSGKFRPGRGMSYCFNPDLKAWLAQLENCYITMATYKKMFLKYGKKKLSATWILSYNIWWLRDE